MVQIVVGGIGCVGQPMPRYSKSKLQILKKGNLMSMHTENQRTVISEQISTHSNGIVINDTVGQQAGQTSSNKFEARVIHANNRNLVDDGQLGNNFTQPKPVPVVDDGGYAIASSTDQINPVKKIADTELGQAEHNNNIQRKNIVVATIDDATTPAKKMDVVTEQVGELSSRSLAAQSIQEKDSDADELCQEAELKSDNPVSQSETENVLGATKPSKDNGKIMGKARMSPSKRKSLNEKIIALYLGGIAYQGIAIALGQKRIDKVNDAVMKYVFQKGGEKVDATKTITKTPIGWNQLFPNMPKTEYLLVERDGEKLIVTPYKKQA